MPMNAAHHDLLSSELATAKQLIADARYEEAFQHLERAHVLGQAFVRWHVAAHWLILKVAVHRRDPYSAFGQALRIVLGAIGSAVGRVPVGNTGGSDVSMFRHMSIPPDLSAVMQRDHVPT